MIIDGVLALKSKSTLMDAIHRASGKKLTPDELLEQRVSFVFGSMKQDNGVTKDQVRQAIRNQMGAAQATAE
jgi:SpoU rRNA methylase family enzyme